MAIDYAARAQLIDRQKEKNLLAKIEEVKQSAAESQKHELNKIADLVKENMRMQSTTTQTLSTLFDTLGKTLGEMNNKTGKSAENIDESLSRMGEMIAMALKEAKPSDMTDGKTIKMSIKEEMGDQQKELFGNLSKGIFLIANILKNMKFPVLPAVFPVKGSIDVEKLPPVHVENMPDFYPYFETIQKKIELLGNMVQSPATSSPIDPSPALRSLIKQLSSLEKSFSGVKESLTTLQPTESVDRTDELLESLEKMEETMDGLLQFHRNKVDFVPPPVTNININALSGFIKTTAATVSTTPIGLPTYGVLANRRAIVIYNNDANITLYYGGSEVTASTGMPVPPNSYSPILDLGVTMVPYAVTSTGSVNVRVMEVSNSAKGM